MHMIDKTNGNSNAPRFEYDGTNGSLVVRVRLSDVRSDEALAAFIESVEAHLDGQPLKVVVFNIAEHELLSSGALGAFLRFRKQRAEISLRNASAHVVEILERTNLDQLIGIQAE